MIPRTLTVAGSDSSGGAGIQADLKTFEEYGTFGFSALTSIVTMNPDEDWSHTVTALDASLVEKQLKTIFTGKKIDAMKTGMLGTVGTIEITEYFLKKYTVPNIVIDPVMACKGTTQLLQPENVEAMKSKLLPLASITTPNLIEAGILSELGELVSLDDMKKAAKTIRLLGPEYVVIKGGKRLEGERAFDLFYDGDTYTLFSNGKLATDFNHGAGCTFAAAVTSGLAKGFSMEKSVHVAKDFVFLAIKHGIEINQYLGHVWHGAYNHAETRLNSDQFSTLLTKI